MPELCTEPLTLDCPGDAPPCQGFCMLRVCARYDTIAGSADIQNLTVAFVGRRTAPPVTTAELEETSASECYWNFNAGRGYVEYVDANGNRNRLDRDEMDKALDRIPFSPDPSIWAERQRIIDKGHCTIWTPYRSHPQLRAHLRHRHYERRLRSVLTPRWTVSPRGRIWTTGPAPGC